MSVETKEYRTVDKSDWPRGPWNDEPDKKQWTDEATGLPCLIHRGPSGALCGYVGVTDGHIYFRVDYGAVDVDVHGGLTYADFCSPSDDESHGICHVPAAGEPDHVWWLGFDCAHFGDCCPEFKSSANHTYRDFDYVTAEVTRLAAQLKSAGEASA
jgi:hypothetical protein